MPTISSTDTVRRKPASKADQKVHKVMSEFKEGELESSSGQPVKSRAQALAIAMSEAGKSKKKKLGPKPVPTAPSI